MTDNTEALPPLPGGIRLTVTERCELDDWRHESIRIAQRQQVLERDSLPGLVRLIAMLGLYALALESKDERV